MYDKSQLMRGTLEGCILKILSEEVTYGYEIVSRLTIFGFQDIREGTIYPLLVRLEKKGYITSEFRPSPLGPSRKYYEITEAGKLYLEEFLECWLQVEAAMDCIFQKERRQEQDEVK